MLRSRTSKAMCKIDWKVVKTMYGCIGKVQNLQHSKNKLVLRKKHVLIF